MNTISKMNPTNKDDEKKKFFFDARYNPQFTYAEQLSEKEKQQYGEVSDQFLGQAEKITQHVLKRWGNESAFLTEAEGELMSREAVQKQAGEYLKRNQLESKVQVKFVPGLVSPGSMTGNILSFRLPIAERTIRLEGTLNHEVGTHYYRRLNDEHQPWFGKREEYHLHSSLDTEEGLAIIHSHFQLTHKYLWFAALYYLGVYYGNQMSFVELNKYLSTFIDDRDRRWNITLRMKRGITDTSVPGAYAKDQVYLRGVIKVLDWLEQHSYDPTRLYIGKIAIEDLEYAERLVGEYVPKLPVFLQESERAAYKAGVIDLRKQNGF